MLWLFLSHDVRCVPLLRVLPPLISLSTPAVGNPILRGVAAACHLSATNSHLLHPVHRFFFSVHLGSQLQFARVSVYRHRHIEGVVDDSPFGVSVKVVLFVVDVVGSEGGLDTCWPELVWGRI